MDRYSNSDKIDSLPELGDFILCKECGQRHEVFDLTSVFEGKIWVEGIEVPPNTVFVYYCDGDLYAAGVDGKDIR